MRRVFALLLLTPFLANCADTATPVAPAGALHTEGAASPEGEWPAEENWFTPGGALELLEDAAVQSASETSLQAAGEAAAQNANEPQVMTFGNPTAGSDFGSQHDQSYHARWKINPGSVVINAGETVTFKVAQGHRVAIYDDGMRPNDIPNPGPNAGPFLLYPTNRLFLQPLPTPQFTLKFVRPGKYLVLCAINMHFFGANQWGWIHVK